MSTMRLATVVGATITTCVFVLTYALEALAGNNLLPRPVHATVNLTALIFWFGFIAALCRDHIVSHVSKRAGDILAAIDAAIQEVGDRRATAARVDALRQISAADTVGRRPHLVET